MEILRATYYIVVICVMLYAAFWLHGQKFGCGYAGRSAAERPELGGGKLSHPPLKERKQ